MSFPMEKGWVLERGAASNPKYLTVNELGFEWTYDHSRAIRLARREDAVMLASIIDDVERIAEHIWG